MSFWEIRNMRELELFQIFQSFAIFWSVGALCLRINYFFYIGE